MDADGRYQEWFDGLAVAQRSAAIDVRGELPDWMIESLERSHVPIVAAWTSEEGRLRRYWLMPTSLTDFLEVAQPTVAST